MTLTGPSSFWSTDSTAGDGALTVQDADDQTTYTTIAVKLPKPSLVYQVYLQAQRLTEIYGFVTPHDTEGKKSEFYGIGYSRCNQIDNDSVNGSLIGSCNLSGQYFTMIRQSHFSDLWLEKMAVTGYTCDMAPM